MKKIIVFLILCVLFEKISAQDVYSNQIKIEVSLRGTIEGEIYYLNTLERYKMDSATVNMGQLLFHYQGEPDGLIVERARDKKDVVVFWSDQVDIKVTGSIDDITHVDVVGSKINDKLLLIKPIINALMSQRNDAHLSGNNHIADTLTQKIHNVYLSEINANPNSYYGLLILFYAVAGKFISAPEAVSLTRFFQPQLGSTKLGLNLMKLIKPDKRIAVGSMAPVFNQLNEKGKPIYLQDYKGKFVLLEFWASWCGPCLIENPNLVKLYLKYSGKPFEVLGISLDSDKTAWLGAIHSQGLPWPQLSDLKGQRNEVGQLYLVTSVPQNVLIDPAGKIVALNLSAGDLDRVLRAEFEKNNLLNH